MLESHFCGVVCSAIGRREYGVCIALVLGPALLLRGGGGLSSVGIAAAAPSLEMMAKGSKGGSASFVVLSGARLAEVPVE